ncbi:Xaa-Pro dipeptidase [Azospirillum lipoferum]|nr:MULTISPECIES: Xaa-Pro peptidase family protein [Azospirillum]MCP1612826.1 Xaa-Pro dipeptidase [Azospirillum lipoferum]MDW5532035.1 Xaa-Pro peptidase family protein [Azospirillum sp. NL1]
MKAGSSAARFAPRMARLREAMAAGGCDAFLADHAELIAWISGYTVSETLYRAVIVPMKGGPCFVLRSIDAGPCRAGVWFDDVATFDDHEDPHGAVADALAARSLAGARIGVDPLSYGHTVATAQRLAGLLPAACFVPLPGLSDRLRACKFADEIDAIAAAAAIADRCMLGLEGHVHPGQTVREVAAMAAAAQLRLGADDGGPGPILVSGGHGSGGHVDFLHGSGLDRTLTPGDILHVELTPRVGNYGARLMRPVFVGDPPAGAAETFSRLEALQDRQIAAMQPGALARDVDALLRTAVLAAGLRADYGNVTGYAMGLYARTPRPSDFSQSFHPAAGFVLEPGQVFHMYASARGVAVSETVLVTDSGPRRLTACPRRPMHGA